VRADAAQPKVWNLWTLDLSNGEMRQITNNKYGQPWGGSWFPDGRRIVFQVHRDGAWLLELGNGSMRRVLEDPTAEEYTWAPDGRRVAYHSRRSGTWGVWVMAPRLASR
jgi:Tol biopolymer transport system component